MGKYYIFTILLYNALESEIDIGEGTNIGPEKFGKK